jgi:hypothetical protein
MITVKRLGQVGWRLPPELFDEEGNPRPLTVRAFLAWCKKHVSPAGYALVVEELKKMGEMEVSAQ